MPEPLKFFVNQSAQDVADALVVSFSNQAPSGPSSVNQRDTARPVEIHFLKENPNSEADGKPFVYVDPTGTTGEIAIGQYLQAVTGGTFTITDPGAVQTTAAIPFDATAATIQSSIRAALATNFSAATVTGNAGGPWVIDRGTTGPYTHDVTGGTDGITPVNSVAEVVNIQDGTSKINERWQIALYQPSAVLATLSGSYLAAAAIAIAPDTGGSPGINAVQSVKWNADAYAGAVSLTASFPTGQSISGASAANPTVVTTAVAHNLRSGESVTISGDSQAALNGTHTATVLSATTFSVAVDLTSGAGSGGTVAVSRTVGPIAFDAADTDLAAALALHGASSAISSSFAVTKNGPGDYTVTFQGALAGMTIDTMGGSASGLRVPLGLAGTVNCNTEGVLSILAGATQAVTNLQITQIAGGVPSVLAVRDDAIIRASLTPVGAVSSEPLSTQAFVDPSTGALINPTAIQFCAANGIPIFFKAVTGYTGGGSSNLDGVATVGLPVGLLAGIRLADAGLQWFELQAGTDAEAAPGIVRGDDFDATTNAKVWAIVS